MDWFLEHSVNVFPSLLSALSKSRLFKAKAKRDTALKRAFKEKKVKWKSVFMSAFDFFSAREKYQFGNTAVNVFEYHGDAYGWVSFLQMLLHMFFFFPLTFLRTTEADICGGLHFHIIESRPFPLRGRIWLSWKSSLTAVTSVQIRLQLLPQQQPARACLRGYLP